jgi:hypothetical protein
MEGIRSYLRPERELNFGGCSVVRKWKEPFKVGIANDGFGWCTYYLQYGQRPFMCIAKVDIMSVFIIP